MALNEALREELRRRKTPRDRRERILASVERLRQQPGVIAEHNVAAALGDAGLWRAASSHIERAFALGGDAAESWLVRARALTELAQHSAAEGAYLETLRRQPLNFPAHRELAQLIWMRTGDINAAMVHLNRAVAGQPQNVALMILRAQVLEGAGFVAEAYDEFRPIAAAYPGDPGVAAVVSQTALSAGDIAAALRLGRVAFERAPGAPISAVAYASACLASGDAEAAAAPIAALRAANGNNQHAIALQALMWRLTGDDRYRGLYDYETVVRPYWLAAPQGWDSLASYVADLAQALHAAHNARAHPFNQSIKQGTQATSILDLEHPALRALPAALDPPIRQYLADIGAGADPLRSRRTQDYAIHGVWSISMAAGGRHIDHVHSEGWISSACYIEVPVAPGREGWLKFGEPGLAMAQRCDAEHFVEPQPGRLVLFPSYMWHGTIPFSGHGRRLTFALDIIPD